MKDYVKPKIKRNPEKTKKLLLESGIKLFSSHGYSGVSVDQIVHEAHCNKRMLYYYFQSKDGLYTEVLRTVFQKLEACEMEEMDEVTDTRAAIRGILARYFDFLQENPDFVSLLLFENLNKGRFLDTHPHLLSKAPILEQLSHILRDGEARGEIRPVTTDHRHILTLLIGTCFIYFSNRHTLRHTLGLDLRQPSVLQQGLQLAQDILLNGLTQASVKD